MNVLALVERADHVCYRYRIEAFAWALGERGMMLEAVPLARSVPRRLAQFRRARAADVVILQRKLLPLWQLGLLRRASRRLIYDVDDLLFERDSYSRKGPESWSRLVRFWATVDHRAGERSPRVATSRPSRRIGVEECRNVSPDYS